MTKAKKQIIDADIKRLCPVIKKVAREVADIVNDGLADELGDIAGKMQCLNPYDEQAVNYAMDQIDGKLRKALRAAI